MAIQYIYPPTQEPVEKERWAWVAVYHDGSKLEQFEVKNGQATFHRFGEIDTSQLAELWLVHASLPPIITPIPEGAKPVHFYTTGVKQSLLEDGIHMVTTKYRGYKVGYNLAGQDFGVLVDHDDSIRIINNFVAANVAEGVNE